MTRVAISGRRNLTDEIAMYVPEQLTAELARPAESGPVVGVSCPADRAGQIPAAAVLAAGGLLGVVVPSVKYRDGLHGSASYLSRSSAGRARRP